ncbi:MAG: hypothetical protein IJZ42_10315 [Lachnospiraceae bacterium]|nr:hypothetical protein [Lachnospiraceae bacterium]
MITTMEDLRSAPDSELLQMYEDAQGDTKEFTQKFGTEFSYTSLTSEIKNRGYKQGWIKEGMANSCKEVEVNLNCKKDRMYLNMDVDCKKKYENFLKKQKNSYIFTTAALMHFMKEYEQKELQIVPRIKL